MTGRSCSPVANDGSGLLEAVPAGARVATTWALNAWDRRQIGRRARAAERDHVEGERQAPAIGESHQVVDLGERAAEALATVRFADSRAEGRRRGIHDDGGDRLEHRLIEARQAVGERLKGGVTGFDQEADRSAERGPGERKIATGFEAERTGRCEGVGGVERPPVRAGHRRHARWISGRLRVGRHPVRRNADLEGRVGPSLEDPAGGQGDRARHSGGRCGTRGGGHERGWWCGRWVLRRRRARRWTLAARDGRPDA